MWSWRYGAGIGLAFNTRLSSMVATAIAPTGAMFTFLALWTGALWGKPMWGTWWVWDARLTSELILLFLYIGFMSLQAAIDDPRRADKAGAMIALVGVVNIPIIYFSVKWWNTLHQGAIGQPYPIAQRWPRTMLTGMLIMSLACWMYALRSILIRTRAIILERERHTAWVGELQGAAQVIWTSVSRFSGHGRLWVLRVGILSGRADLHRRGNRSGF